MSTLTVFTPTYNRAHTLKRTYEWMKKQTRQDFVWLIVDDGSTDGTEQMVRKWMSDGLHDFTMQYVWKENGGLHTGYNKAFEIADTELIVCVDSDDYMPADAVETILTFWDKNKSPEYAGIIGLDYLESDSPVCGFLPEVKSMHIIDLWQKYHYKGDTKVVMRLDLLKAVPPQPTYNGEKNFNPIYMMLQIDALHDFLVINKNLCYVDYQPDGMTANIFRQFINSPNSFAALRVLMISLPTIFPAYKLKQYLHLVSSVCLAKNLSWLGKSKCPVLAYAMLPLGFLLSRYIKYKAKKQ